MKHKSIEKTTDAYPGLSPLQRMGLVTPTDDQPTCDNRTSMRHADLYNLGFERGVKGFVYKGGYYITDSVIEHTIDEDFNECIEDIITQAGRPVKTEKEKMKDFFEGLKSITGPEVATPEYRDMIARVWVGISMIVKKEEGNL